MRKQIAWLVRDKIPHALALDDALGLSQRTTLPM
jgi:hypothetical protein